MSRPGQDLLIQSLSGLAANTGRAGEVPTPAGTSFVDASTALMLAFSAMVGLYHKARTGQGQRIDVSLFNTAIALQCQELSAFMNLNLTYERSASGIGSPWLSAPFGIYQTRDGYLALAMASLSVVGEVLDMPALSAYDTPKAAYEQRDTIKPLIQARLLDETTDHWLERLLERDVWCAKVQNFEDLMTDPQVAHNDLIQTIHHPDAGELRVIGIPVKFSETPGTIRLAPPRVGEHTDALLDELGYGADAIDVAARGRRDLMAGERLASWSRWKSSKTRSRC